MMTMMKRCTSSAAINVRFIPVALQMYRIQFQAVGLLTMWTVYTAAFAAICNGKNVRNRRPKRPKGSAGWRVELLWQLQCHVIVHKITPMSYTPADWYAELCLHISTTYTAIDKSECAIETPAVSKGRKLQSEKWSTFCTLCRCTRALVRVSAYDESICFTWFRCGVCACVCVLNYPNSFESIVCRHSNVE